MVYVHDIRLKKKFGQHFLRDKQVVEYMLNAVTLNTSSSVFEIGCGDGFLTKAILEHPIARLWVFEIDFEWAEHVKKSCHDERLKMYVQDFLTVDPAIFVPHVPWVVLANLSYQITFPVLHFFVQHRALLKEGVIMIQEEVAQKIVKTKGKNYGYVSLYMQHFFQWRLLDKVLPHAFVPPPKVFSRLIYFKPKEHIQAIPQEEEFWHFIKCCFKQPRRTLKNNLQQSAFHWMHVPPKQLELRAQQLSMDDFLHLWNQLIQGVKKD